MGLNDTPMLDTRTEPKKIVFERRVRPGAERAFKMWLERLLEAAVRSPGFEGSSVLAVAESGEHVILLRFATQDHLDQWQSSPDVIRHLAEGDAVSDVTARGPVVRSGLETWFTLPGIGVPTQAPPKWKMALVTWVALLPQVILLAYLIPPTAPFLLSVAISTAVPVAALTWFVMPWATRLLYGWLYTGRELTRSGRGT